MTTTMLIENVEHVVASYNDEIGHGVTLCGERICPGDVGPRLDMQVTCPKCWCKQEKPSVTPITREQYENFLALTREREALIKNFEAHAKEVGKALFRGEIREVTFLEKQVVCAPRDGLTSDEVWSYKVDLLFDPDWKAAIARHHEAREKQYAAEHARLEERARQALETKERAELEKLVAKYMPETKTNAVKARGFQIMAQHMLRRDGLHSTFWMTAMNSGNYTRAGGDVECPICLHAYREHPELPNYPTFHALCDGTIVKT